MNAMWIVLIVIAIIVVLLIAFFVSTYNKLVNLRNMVQDQWSQIDVLLKRRADLIPNLVETVKGYASHEKETLDAVISARNKAVSATTPEDEMKANGELTQALGRLFAISEDKIAYARQFYNDAVLGYKNKLEMFPSNIVASMFGFKPEAFFEATEADKEVPKVQF